MQYEDGFKDRMVQRMAGSERISATRLSREVGVAQATLSRWLRDASTLGAMGKDKNRRTKSHRRSPQQDGFTGRLQLAALSLRHVDILRKWGVHSFGGGSLPR